VGLQNVERRLAHQYRSAASLTVDSTPGLGTTVTIRLPLSAGTVIEPASEAM
jgi:sensor histidine kinase YesM